MLNALSGADLRALRVFQVISDCGSFAAAERLLDIRQSTISAQISGLEERMGFRLCERGPGGFRLTERGRAVLEAHQDLSQAIDDFVQTADDLAQRAVGTLRLGLMDHISTDPTFSITELMRQFHQRAPGVDLVLTQDIQSDLVDQMLKKTIDLAIGAFPSGDRRFDQTPLYVERQFIYCGRLHPLYDNSPQSLGAEALRSEDWVRRSYNLVPLEGYPIDIEHAVATAANLEAVSVILCSLPTLGYLPPHVAAPLVTQGQLRRVTDSHTISFQVSLLSRAGRRDSAAMKRFRNLALSFARRTR